MFYLQMRNCNYWAIFLWNNLYKLIIFIISHWYSIRIGLAVTSQHIVDWTINVFWWIDVAKRRIFTHILIIILNLVRIFSKTYLVCIFLSMCFYVIKNLTIESKKDRLRTMVFFPSSKYIKYYLTQQIRFHFTLKVESKNKYI